MIVFKEFWIFNMFYSCVFLVINPKRSIKIKVRNIFQTHSLNYRQRESIKARKNTGCTRKILKRLNKRIILLNKESNFFFRQIYAGINTVGSLDMFNVWSHGQAVLSWKRHHSAKNFTQQKRRLDLLKICWERKKIEIGLT